MIHRSEGVDGWHEFGRVPGDVYFLYPLGDDRVLVLGEPDLLVTTDGNTPVETGRGPHEDAYQFSSSTAGDRTVLVTSRNRILSSLDGGLTWTPLP